jgi:hypothetical protein
LYSYIDSEERKYQIKNHYEGGTGHERGIARIQLTVHFNHCRTVEEGRRIPGNPVTLNQKESESLHEGRPMDNIT